MVATYFKKGDPVPDFLCQTIYGEPSSVRFGVDVVVEAHGPFNKVFLQREERGNWDLFDYDPNAEELTWNYGFYLCAYDR